MTSRAVQHQHTFLLRPNIEEVVVNEHAERTTTSEQSHLGVITKPKRKLITSETETASNIAVVVVADPSRSTTTSNSHSALYPHIEEVVRYSLARTTTTVQAQPPTSAEEGIRGIAPPSSEISFPAAHNERQVLHRLPSTRSVLPSTDQQCYCNLSAPNNPAPALS